MEGDGHLATSDMKALCALEERRPMTNLCLRVGVDSVVQEWQFSSNETTQKPVKGALGNRRSKCTDQQLALGRSVQVEFMG